MSDQQQPSRWDQGTQTDVDWEILPASGQIIKFAASYLERNVAALRQLKGIFFPPAADPSPSGSPSGPSIPPPPSQPAVRAGTVSPPQPQPRKSILIAPPRTSPESRPRGKAALPRIPRFQPRGSPPVTPQTTPPVRASADSRTGPASAAAVTRVVGDSAASITVSSGSAKGSQINIKGVRLVTPGRKIPALQTFLRRQVKKKAATHAGSTDPAVRRPTRPRKLDFAPRSLNEV